MTAGWSRASHRALRAVCEALLPDDDPAWSASVAPRVADLLLAAGAEEILTMQNRPVRYRPRAGGSLQAWQDEIDRVGFGSNQMLYFSFHQMGTCRMGARRRDAVTNGDGEVYGLPGLFVADASLFPSASGVNPMVTVAALAYHVAQQVRSRL